MTIEELLSALERDGWTDLQPLMVSGIAVLIAHHEHVDIGASDDDAQVRSERGTWHFAGPHALRTAYKRAAKELRRNAS